MKPGQLYARCAFFLIKYASLLSPVFKEQSCLRRYSMLGDTRFLEWFFVDNSDVLESDTVLLGE